MRAPHNWKAWRAKLQKGDLCDVCDSKGVWHEGIFMEVFEGHVKPGGMSCARSRGWRIRKRGIAHILISDIRYEEAHRLAPPYTHVRNWRKELAVGDRVLWESTKLRGCFTLAKIVKVDGARKITIRLNPGGTPIVTTRDFAGFRKAR
jgi:hypothetical protein